MNTSLEMFRIVSLEVDVIEVVTGCVCLEQTQYRPMGATCHVTYK